MALRIEVQSACNTPGIPTSADLRAWATEALCGRMAEAELTLRLVEVDESADLNQRFRGCAGATNVLSFPAELPAGAPLSLLGDIVICAPVVEREAKEQCKSPAAHWAHMVVHGILHLLGYLHEEDDEAQEMEAIEREILARLGFSNPYQEMETHQSAS